MYEGNFSRWLFHADFLYGEGPKYMTELFSTERSDLRESGPRL